MRKELFDQLIESVKQMKEIQRGRRKASRTVRTEDLLSGAAPDVAALRAHFGLSQSSIVTSCSRTGAGCAPASTPVRSRHWSSYVS
jgi:hypothetical protein